SVTFSMIRCRSASRSPMVDSARLTSWTSATFFCSRRKAAASDCTDSDALEASPLASDTIRIVHRKPDRPRGRIRLFHAAAAQVVLVEAFEVTDFVEQRVADLLR